MSLLQDPGLTEDLSRAIRDVHDYGDWQDRTGYARLDAKARYNSAMRSLGFLVNPAGGGIPADPNARFSRLPRVAPSGPSQRAYRGRRLFPPAHARRLTPSLG